MVKSKKRNILYFIISFILSFIAPMIGITSFTTYINKLTSELTVEQGIKYVNQGLLKMGFIALGFSLAIFLIGLLLKSISFRWGIIGMIGGHALLGILAIIFIRFALQNGIYQYSDFGTDSVYLKFMTGLSLFLLAMLILFAFIFLIYTLVKKANTTIKEASV